MAIHPGQGRVSLDEQRSIQQSLSELGVCPMVWEGVPRRWALATRRSGMTVLSIPQSSQFHRSRGRRLRRLSPATIQNLLHHPQHMSGSEMV